MATITRHWIGVKPNDLTLVVAILDTEGVLLEQLEVPNERRYMVRLLRQWVKRAGLVPEHCVFCVENRGPVALMVISFLLEREWTVRTIDTEKLGAHFVGHDLPIMDAVGLVAFTQRFPDLVTPFDQARSRSARMEHLRTRREQLLADRSKCVSRMEGDRRYMETELQREFERMERRQMDLIDRLVQRIEMLIALQLPDVSIGERPDEPSVKRTLGNDRDRSFADR